MGVDDTRAFLGVHRGNAALPWSGDFITYKADTSVNSKVSNIREAVSLEVMFGMRAAIPICRGLNSSNADQFSSGFITGRVLPRVQTHRRDPGGSGVRIGLSSV